VIRGIKRSPIRVPSATVEVPGNPAGAGA
jgi:hypothetical protein